MKKRIGSLLLILALCFTLLPTAALAEGETIKEVNSAPELKNAIETGSNSIVKLTADIEISTTLTVNRTVTLDLNDHVLKKTGTGRVIEVKNGVNLTLVDNAEMKTEKYFDKDSTGLWTLATGTTENTVNGGVITGGNADAGSYGGGVKIASGTFTMTGGNIVGCTAYVGGGVDVSGTFTMTGGSVAGCVATHASGGGVYVESGGAFEMSGGSIAGCTAASRHASGGGICNTGTTTLSGSAKIQNCRASLSGYGGGIESVGALTVNGNVEITGCTKDTTLDAMHFEKGTVSGGTFDGKVTNESGTIGGGTFSGTVTNNGTINGGTFAVTFDTKGGSTVPVQNVLNGQKATKPTNPTKTGYTFDGWYTDETCTNPYDFATSVQNALTLYAKWTINQYTITFKLENGDKDTTITQDYGTLVTAPANPTRTGYTFAGWNREIPATMPAENMTVTAQWTAVGSPVTPPSSGSSGGSSGGSSREDREPSYAVSTPSKTENGTVSVNTKNARQGDRVTLTAKADPGYVLETLTVLDSKGRELALTNQVGGKFTFTMPAGRVEVRAVFAAEVKTAPFRDVPTDAYYYDAVKWAAEKGITTGQANGLFGSDQSCTRAQIITFLWRAAGSPVVNYAMEMGDVSADAYYAEAVRWAVSRGITSGTGGGAFSPDDACTRAQAVTLLARALSTKAGSAANFTDVPADAYYAQAVSWAVENGITTGVGGGRFDPNATCTRAQIATFLYRLYLSR